MSKLIVYPAVCLGMLSLPALFFAGMYLLQKKFLTARLQPLKRWLAAFSYSAAIFAGWWAVYFFGGLVPFGTTDNSLATVSLMFGYSAYALLPVALATGAVSVMGALVCAARSNAGH